VLIAIFRISVHVKKVMITRVRWLFRKRIPASVEKNNVSNCNTSK